jgi:hypothetical protein
MHVLIVMTVSHYTRFVNKEKWSRACIGLTSGRVPLVTSDCNVSKGATADFTYLGNLTSTVRKTRVQDVIGTHLMRLSLKIFFLALVISPMSD